MKCWQCNSEVGRAQVLCDTCGASLMSRPRGAGGKVARPETETVEVVVGEDPLNTPLHNPLTSGFGNLPFGEVDNNGPTTSGEDIHRDENQIEAQAEVKPNWLQIGLLTALASMVLSIPLCLMMAWRSQWPKQHKIIFSICIVGYGLLVTGGLVISLVLMFQG